MGCDVCLMFSPVHQAGITYCRWCEHQYCRECETLISRPVYPPTSSRQHGNNREDVDTLASRLEGTKIAEDAQGRPDGQKPEGSRQQEPQQQRAGTSAAGSEQFVLAYRNPKPKQDQAAKPDGQP